MSARDIYAEFQTSLNTLTADEVHELNERVYRHPNEYPVEFLRAVSVARSIVAWT